MKIRVPARRVPDRWWVGLEWLCRHCGCLFEVGPEDDVELGTDAWAGVFVARCYCPECHIRTYEDKPGQVRGI